MWTQKQTPERKDAMKRQEEDGYLQVKEHLRPRTDPSLVLSEYIRIPKM